MGCFSKFFLFILNFIVFAMGVAVIVLASLILANSDDFKVLLSDGVFTLPIILLILGIIVMLIGFFGCFGAMRESPCLLYTYATIVLVLLCAQIGVAVYGLVEKDEIQEKIANSMAEVFSKYGGDDTELNNALDAAQHQLQCCGVYNYTDWNSGYINSPLPANTVPPGCCKTNVTGCYQNVNTNPDNIYVTGCYTLLVDTIRGQALWLAIGAIILGLVQLGCVLIACGIGKRGGSDHRVY
ncbi:tetraspanin-like protein 8-like [Hyalella azteca]|uniref:Tetraspanin n=1 Tax=Hyalella azteca TaxID=294128 RepID=A0A6A0HAK2_HYAAZ|nr:tetraspanin-3 [Hyalella azteca]KAA0201987.1 tetraspanin-like protein 8-like [Hyalella azteca]